MNNNPNIENTKTIFSVELPLNNGARLESQILNKMGEPDTFESKSVYLSLIQIDADHITYGCKLYLNDKSDITLRSKSDILTLMNIIIKSSENIAIGNRFEEMCKDVVFSLNIDHIDNKDDIIKVAMMIFHGGNYVKLTLFLSEEDITKLLQTLMTILSAWESLSKTSFKPIEEDIDDENDEEDEVEDNCDDYDAFDCCDDYL